MTNIASEYKKNKLGRKIKKKEIQLDQARLGVGIDDQIIEFN